MPNQKNIDAVKAIGEDLSKAKTVVFANYIGLKVSDQTELRNKIRETGGSFAVQKNNLVRLAVKKKMGEVPAALDEVLNGPTAVLYGFDDPVTATKALVEFAKTNENLKIKAGVLMGETEGTDKVLSLAEVNSLASLPSREELLGQLVNRLNSPIQGFANVLSGTLRSLVQVLNAVKDQKSTA